MWHPLQSKLSAGSFNLIVTVLQSACHMGSIDVVNEPAAAERIARQQQHDVPLDSPLSKRSHTPASWCNQAKRASLSCPQSNLVRQQRPITEKLGNHVHRHQSVLMTDYLVSLQHKCKMLCLGQLKGFIPRLGRHTHRYWSLLLRQPIQQLVC